MRRTLVRHPARRARGPIAPAGAAAPRGERPAGADADSASLLAVHRVTREGGKRMRIESKRRLLALVAAVFVTAGAAIAVAVAQPSANAAGKPSIIWLEQGAGNPAWDQQHK